MPDQVRRFSTADLAPAASVAAWRHLLGEVYYDLEVQPGADVVRASITETNCGALGITRLTCNPTKVSRLKQKTIRDDAGFHVMLLPLSGSLTFEQGGREGIVAPGDAVLLRSAEPYEVASPGHTDHLCLRMPQAILPSRMPGLEDLCATDALVSHPMIPMLADFLVGTLRTADMIALPARLETCCIDLATLVIDYPRDGTVPTRAGTKVDRLSRAFDRLFAQQELTLEIVANACGMSTRSLQRLLRGRGTTFGREVRARRLREADRLLRSPSAAILSIGDIAVRCGFVNQGHFATCYREEYGHCPSQVQASSRAAD